MLRKPVGQKIDITKLDPIKSLDKVVPHQGINWYVIARDFNLSEELLEKHSDYIDWKAVSIFQKLSEDTIIKFCEKIDWSWASSYQKLTKRIMLEYGDKIAWKIASKWQELDEEIIEKYKDKVNWNHILEFQKVSLELLLKHFDLMVEKEVSFECLEKNAKIEKEIVEKFMKEIDWENVLKNKKITENFVYNNKSFFIKNKIDYRIANRNPYLCDCYFY